MNKNDRMAMMAELPVPQVLVKMSLPMMISFFIQAMYNIVDSMFVARISENALTAVSLAFPMQQIVMAIGVGLSTGVSAVWSRYMGMKDEEKAHGTIRTMTLMCLVFSVLFVFLGIYASAAMLRMQTDVAEIAEMGTVYLTINWTLAFAGFYSKYFERLLVSAGRPILSMTAMASGAIFNLIFDPLLIFGIGPFPAMGITGAAIATMAGQILAAVVAIIFNMIYNEPVRKDMLAIGFHPDAALAITRVALPSVIVLGLSSLTSFFINQILLVYSTTATAVYGVWMKLQNFCYMPTFGLNNGMVPILSYNYGIKKLDRVRETMNLALKAILLLMVFLTVLFEIIPGTVLTMFSAGETMRSMGMICLRACVLSLPLGAYSMILGTSMQALDHSRYAMAINLTRQCVLLVGSFAVISALTHSQSLIWLAVPFTEAITFILTMILNRKFRKDLGI